MRIFSLLIPLFSIYIISFMQAGHSSSHCDAHTITIPLYHPDSEFNKIEDELINLEVRHQKKKWENVITEMTKMEKKPFLKRPHNSYRFVTGPYISREYPKKTIKVQAPSKKERCVPTNNQLKIIAEKILRHVNAASNQDITLTHRAIESGLAYVKDALGKELNASETESVYKDIRGLLPELRPTAYDLAERAAHIIAAADRLYENGISPNVFLIEKQEELEQTLSSEKFNIYMDIFEKMAKINVATDE